MPIIAPFDLKSEYLPDPLGIVTPAPRFSWSLTSDHRNDKQTAYQVIVSSEPEIAQREIGDIWDSGPVETGQNSQILYAGEPLLSSVKYYWRIRWWDSGGRTSPYSRTAFFVTGLLKEKDWRAKWISKRERREYRTKGTVLLGEYRGDYVQTHALYFRKKFTVRQGIRRALAYVCGLGYHELRLNGQKIGNQVLEPAQTDYSKIALYSTHDITDRISAENALGIIVGNGRHIKNFGYGHPKLIVQIELEYENFERERIISDETWKVSFGPLTENGIYSGERYDAREEQPGWDEAQFEDYSWGESAVLVQGPPLAPHLLPPIRVVKTLQPLGFFNPRVGVFIYDFGQNFSGWTRLQVQGARGTAITLRYAELLHEDGSLNTATNQNAEATDVYILKGGGPEVYEPRFTYHGFRYVELSGYPGQPNLETLLGCFVHSDVSPAGDFRCSDGLINRIHQNILWGQLSNLMSIPTDCPQRDERHGWLADAHLAAEEAILNFDMAAFYTKYLEDIRLAQREDGSLPDLVPPYFSHLYPADPAWSAAYVILAWQMYRYYEDRKVLEKHFQALKKYVDFLSSRADGAIIKNLGKYGDWCPPGSIPPKRTPLELTSTWYFYHDTLIFSQIARVLGRVDDARTYSHRAEEIKDAFNRAFLGEDQYAAVRISPVDRMPAQTSNILPLYLDMAPEGKKPKILERLLYGIENDLDFHLNTGIIGTRYLFDVLTKNGYGHTAFRMVRQKSYPGYGYMIEEGATTLWERWEKITGGGMNSHNHIMLGSVDAWLYGTIAGLTCLEPGWKKILAKPPLFRGLESAGATLETIRGRVQFSWEKRENSLEMSVSVPVGCEAEIRVPLLSGNNLVKEGQTLLWEDGRWKQKTPEFSFLGIQEGYLVLACKSGEYHFKIEKP
jgi:alpha-L-rhamnosidase